MKEVKVWRVTYKEGVGRSTYDIVANNLYEAVDWFIDEHICNAKNLESVVLFSKVYAKVPDNS